jgi:hypothetical protein
LATLLQTHLFDAGRMTLELDDGLRGLLQVENSQNLVITETEKESQINFLFKKGTGTVPVSIPDDGCQCYQTTGTGNICKKRYRYQHRTI